MDTSSPGHLILNLFSVVCRRNASAFEMTSAATSASYCQVPWPALPEVVDADLRVPQVVHDRR